MKDDSNFSAKQIVIAVVIVVILLLTGFKSVVS